MKLTRVLVLDQVGSRLTRAALPIAGIVLGLLGALPSRAATPPAVVNYQGVLRDQNDKPLSGTHDMVFRFMDAPAAGNEILVDQHAAASANAVTVSGGLFNVSLGSGTVTDGSGPGAYATLDEVFRDYGSVWLEVQVGAETLSPRTVIQSAPYALNATQLTGHPDSYFIDTSSAPQTKTGSLLVASNGSFALVGQCDTCAGVQGFGNFGVFGRGDTFGARFLSDASGITTDIATPSRGISVTGGEYGGYFNTTAPNSTGVRASGNFHGLLAEGNVRGGTFSTGIGGTGVFANGGGKGVEASGSVRGGDFSSLGGTGVYASGGDKGVDVDGGNYGGFFEATNVGSYGVYGSGVHTGVRGHGQTNGGNFTNSAGDNATLAAGIGISASSVGAVGAYFSNGAPYFAYTQIPYYDIGIYAYGANYGGQFNAFSTGNYAQTATGAYKILGTGVVSFVQNHPTDPTKVIVYAAPEGDEAAVYTRGSARLVDGEARVRLGETFALVTNPDIGLTATATPRGEPIPLAVSEVSPSEVVVRGPAGSNAAFDYMVWGLRIGFEETSIVQPKRLDSRIPSMHDHEQFFRHEPALRDYTALARFKASEEKLRGRSLDHSRADRLRDAVGVFPYREPGEMAQDPGRLAAAPPVPAAGPSIDEGVAGGSARVPVVAPASPAASSGTGEEAGAVTAGNDAIGTARQFPAGVDLFASEGTIEAGDVVSLVPAAPGSVVRSAGPEDSLVIGCAQPAQTESLKASPADGAARHVYVATSHLALCRVDATSAAIAVGDRLSSSPVPGLAMRAEAGVAGATLLGRAIDPLPSGIGLIRVLLGAR